MPAATPPPRNLPSDKNLPDNPVGNKTSSAGKKTSRGKTAARLLGSIAVTAILIAVVAETQTLDSFAELFFGVHPPALLGYIGISLIALLARALRYRLILVDALGKCNAPRYGVMLIVSAVRNALVDMLPARLGELSFFYVLHRYGVSTAAAATAFTVSLVLDLIILCMLGLAAVLAAAAGFLLLPALFEAPKSTAFLPLSITALALLIGVVLELPRIVTVGTTIAGKLSNILPAHRQAPVRNFLSSFEADVYRVRRSKHYLSVLLLTVLLRTAKYGSLYLLLLAVVHQLNLGANDISFLPVVVAFVAAEASASLPFSGIMGFGAYEGAWTLIFSATQVKIPSVPSVILVVHLITQIVGYSVGLLGLGAFLVREVRR